jgi:hypothetical protein
MTPRIPSRSYSGGSSSSNGGGAIILLLLIIVLFVILVWLLVQAMNQVARGFARAPHSPVLWTTLLASLASTALTAVAYQVSQTPGGAWAGELLPVFACVAALSWVCLLVCSKVVEIWHDDLLRPERERTNTIERVLRRSWWPPLARNPLPYGGREQAPAA